MYEWMYVLQSLEYSPGSRYIYSDLSMITLMYVVGTLARYMCRYIQCE